MPIILELDLGELDRALGRSPILREATVVGPHFHVAGPVETEYRSLDEGVILHAQRIAARETFSYHVARRGWIGLQLTLKGRSVLRSVDTSSPVQTGSLRLTSLAASSYVIWPQESEIHGVGIFLNRNYLPQRFGLHVDGLPPPIKEIFSPKEPKGSSIEIPLPSSCWLTAERIILCEHSEPVRSHYLKAKTTELLCDLTYHLNSLTQAPRSGNGKRTQLIESAATILRSDMSANLSIDDVSRRVALSKSSLMEGFKERYNCTPGEYARAARLERAYALLVGGDLAVSRIGELCGYNDHAAFTRAFRAYYGFPPSQIRR